MSKYDLELVMKLIINSEGKITYKLTNILTTQPSLGKTTMCEAIKLYFRTLNEKTDYQF